MRTYRSIRLVTALISAVLLALSAHGGAFAQAQRSLKIVVPYTPASGPDILSRLMAEQIGRAQGADGGGREPPGRRHRHRHRGRRARGAGRRHRAAGGEFVRGQSRPEARQLRSVQELRAGLPARGDADGAGGQGRFALPHDRRPDRGGARQAGRIVIGERRAGVLAALCLRGAQARGQHQHDLRALWRHRALDQRAHGRSRDGGVRRLSDGGVAAQIRHLARAAHILGRPLRGLAGRADLRRGRPWQIRGRHLLRHRGAGEDAGQCARAAHRLVHRRHAGARGEAQAFPGRPVPGGKCGADFTGILHGLLDDYARVAQEANIK